ncbi:protein unc-80 homolog isoform X6 [Spodoptera litura]|uniref:Protein unc-80 homolog isoform X6 n=1 Tax=Spodoptera litura TaxID=69820 RepID=A0A9J7IWP7_SPOLT|nr:protein unc-80 homolog isoform X6 [Spodoptera litura]
MKSKDMSEEDPNSDEVVPIPVQIFLWRQTTPFVRPRLGKVHDAACMFCQRAPGHHEVKEACKSFEKVLVQNLRFGLSISLADAIGSIPRWRLIQASLPHVMHALAALLHNRVKDNMQSLGNVETKLLYTLHWILLDASDECIEADYENGVFYSNPFHYLFSIPALTLFVFLFAPLSHHLKESDFTNNYRLENGLKMWQAMWEFRHPEAPCFTTLVKPKPKPLGGKYSKRHQPGDVFMGRKLSKEEGGGGNVNGSPPSQNVSISQSEVTSKQASTEEEPWLSSPKDTIFPETIPEESSSTEEEHVFIYRLPSEQNFGGAVKEAYTVYAADPSIFQPRKTDTPKQGLPGIKPLPQITKMSSSDKESLSDSGGGGGGPTKDTPTTEKPPSAKQGNVSAATFLDVATLRCLFTSQWQEEGVYWALHYLYNRLRDICDDMSKQTQPRKRSNSLPIPKIEVSVYQSPDIKDRDSLKNFIEVPEVKDMSPITEMPFTSPTKTEDENIMTRRSSEKIKRKMKMADLKAFVETKLLSKSEKALEKIGHDDHKFSFHSAVRMLSEYHRSLDNTDDRPNSALASNFPPLAPRLTGDMFHCNLIKGKSMPSLSCLIDELASNGYIEEVKTERTQGPSHTMPTNAQKKKNPIITVTEHTPTPSPDYLSKTRQGSLESQIDSVSMQGSQHIPTPERKPSLTRSQTDSNITYVVEEIQEAPGSIHYITKDGDIDFQVVLKAVYSVSTMDSFYITLRVMEVMLNLVDTLMEMGVHKNWQTGKNDDVQPGNIDPLGDFNKDKDSKERDSGIPCAPSQDSTNLEGGDSTKERTKEEDNMDCPYYMIMHVILRLLRQLGCSHGCTTALRGPQAECLRVQARNSLRQLRAASIPKFTTRLKEMTKYAPIREVLDNLHAAVGFCAEPATLVSPMNQQKRSNTKSPDISNLQTGYATNFGAGQGSNASRAIETFIIETTFRVLVTRFALMHKELKMLDNSTLYMEVRLLLSYVREAHGGEFRVVAFSALMDTAERPDSQQKESNMQTTRVIRHIPRQSEEERGSDTGADSGCAPDERSHKKFTFKKRSTSSTGAHSLLETEGGEESASQSPLSVRTRRYQLTPRQSERTIPSASSADITPHHKISHSKSIPSKFHIAGIVNWFRQKPHHSQSLIRNGGGSGESLPISGSMISLARPPHLPPPHTSRPVHVKRRVGYTLNRARKRVEDRLNRFGLRKMGKKRDGSIEDTSGGYMSRRGSAEGGSGGGESEVVILKRRRLVAAAPLYAGLARFSFLLDATQPGGTPDALFMAALLDLPHTVVVARAAMLLECAHLVHNCNKGQWPYWLKSNTSKAAVSLNPQLKRQRLAGKLFYQWAEALGNRLEEMLIEDKKHVDTVVNLVNDPDGQRELLQQDEEEDFLDEASIRLPGKPVGADCPRALRIIACVLLFEITAFLRETYQNLPKTCRSSLKERGPWDRVYRALSSQHTLMPVEEANRRWSMALSSMGHSQASAQSLQSIAGAETERKISFVLHEPENVSGGSNVTLADAIPPAVDDKKGRLGSRGKAGMHRRNTQQTHSAYGSFKRRSIKLRQKDTRDVVDEFVTRRSDSIQSRRKVSSLSDRSDTSEVYPGAGGTVIMSNEVDSGGEESPGVLSDDHDHPPDSPDSNSTDPPDTNKGFPWLKVMVKFLNSFNYVCCHQNFCHPYCFRRNMRASVRLMKSVQKIYGEKFGPEINTTSSDEGNGGTRRGRRSRKSSEHSTDRYTQIERSVIESAGLAYRAAGGEQTNVASEGVPTKPTAMPYPPADPPPILKYLKGQVRDAYHTPLATLIKGATTMGEEMFAECAPVAWQLLLESDRELSSCAAALFILAAVKAPNTATEIMHNDLKHAEPSTRINAILRFQVMWKLRYQVWPRMEEGASVTFKVPPPGIEFTLPSPKIGIESLAVVDPPWTPQVKDKDMEMTLNQERHRSLVTATKTRKKQQTEAIKRALQQRNDKKRAERESFLITTIPITRQAAREPALDHAADDHVDPPADEELVEGVRGSHHTQVASALFPSTLCSAVAEIVSLLDDAAVSRDGCSVYEVAYQVIWCCLVEDSALFLRHVLERLTRDHQDEMFKLLRHLIRFIPRLPQQAAFALYNYIIGYVMFYVRSPHEEGQRLVGAALSILWMVVHSVHGIMFKDLKQILRKEQCDASILLTANVPAAKKIVVHGPPDNEGCIPSQFPVQEDTVFAQILKESLDFFGIPEKLHKEHFLVDFKTRQIHNPQGYVRDHYFFKRSQYPQLCLVHMEPDEAFQKLQEQELLQKFVEIGKVLLTWAILKNVDMVVQRVVFLHDELMKLPSFPRKALEADLVLYSRGALGSTLLGLDVLHKFMWVRLIARMFEAMAGNFTSSRDIHLFLNVLNGALMLHSEDSLILRYVIATYVNAAFNFKSIFSTNGYLLIMPTLLQIYSNFQTNKLVTTTIEYAVKQFYLLNRKPFILQMFGSVSAILDTDEESTYGDASKVQSSCLFNLLLSLETPSPDPLHIAELIKEEKPLKPIDFCYRDEEEMVNVLDCISLCVMVVSYSAESMRGYQMLIILEAILPCYVKQIQLPTYNREGKTEKEIIQQLAIAIKTLVNNCEGLSKSYNGPYRTSPEHKGSSQRTGPRTAAATIIAFEESHSKYDNSKMPVPEYTGAEDSELVRAEYRRPRDVLLSLVGEFIGRATSRLLEINGSNRSGGTEGKPVELLDSKSHARLAEIAHSLLKVSPYDPESMGCRGLQRYMTQVLPAADWADDALRPALIMILRRLDKVFLKIAKKPSIRRNTDWDSAAVLLKGVYETMIRCPYIMHWQHVKTLLNTVQALIVSDNNSGENLSSATAALMSQPPPPHFCSTVVRLIALQIINTGDSYSLEQMCGGSASFPTGEKTENMLMNLFMPLCLRVGSGRKDVPPLRQSDVSYLVSVVLNALCPPAPPGQLAAVNAKLNASDNRANSLTFTGSRDARNTTRLSNQLYRIAFLALKVMCACFTSELCTEWGRIARAMRDLGRRNEAAHHLWDFLEHVVTYRTPLYILLQPFIVHKLSQPPIGDNERHMQFVVRERVRGLKLPAARARGALLAELARELRHMRDTHDQYKFEQIAENLGQAAGKRASEVFPRTTTVPDKHQQHRPSLISMLVGRGGTGGLPRTPDHSSAPLSAQRESLSSSSTTSQHMPTFEAQLNSGRMSDNSNNNAGSGNSHMGSLNNYGSDKPTASTPSYTSTQTKLRFVPSVELKFTSGETSMSPLSPMSPGEASCGESVPARASLDSDMLVGDHSDTPDAGERPRLQRAHGPSKKTFKFRRSRHTKPDVSHVRLESDDGSSPGPETTPLRRAWSQPPFLQPTYINTDTSYDSEISQTSSTSGYRESYSLQASMTESPGGSARVALASPEAGEAGAAADGRSCSATPHASPDGKQPFVCTALLIRNPPHSRLYLFPPVASEQSPLSFSKLRIGNIVCRTDRLTWCCESAFSIVE